MKPTFHPRQRGYSLTEMLVVVAIIGILSLVTVPNFMNMYRAAKMKSSLQQFTTDIRGARQRAVTRVTPMKVSWQQGTGNREYRIYSGVQGSTGITWTQVASGSWTTPAQPRYLDEIAYFAAPASDPFTDQDSPTDDWLDLIIMPSGQVQFPAGTATNRKLVIKTDMEVGKPAYTITVNNTGRVNAQ